MNDDAVYVSYHDEEGLAYIPYWRHELLAFGDRKKIFRLRVATIGAVILLIGSNLAWYFLR